MKKKIICSILSACTVLSMTACASANAGGAAGTPDKENEKAASDTSDAIIGGVTPGISDITVAQPGADGADEAGEGCVGAAFVPPGLGQGERGGGDFAGGEEPAAGAGGAEGGRDAEVAGEGEFGRGVGEAQAGAVGEEGRVGREVGEMDVPADDSVGGRGGARGDRGDGGGGGGRGNRVDDRKGVAGEEGGAGGDGGRQRHDAPV